jgi:hypothetical protein
MQIKSASRLYLSAPKVEWYHLQSLTYLTRENIKYNSSHDFGAYYYISTGDYLTISLLSIAEVLSETK